MTRKQVVLDREVYRLVRANLARLREQAGLSFSDLSDRLGYSSGLLRGVEGGKKGITLDLLEELGREYGVPVSELFQPESRVLDTHRPVVPVPGVQDLYVYDTSIDRIVQGPNPYTHLEITVAGKPYLSAMVQLYFPIEVVLEGGQVDMFVRSFPKEKMPDDFEGFIGAPVSVYYQKPIFEEAVVTGIRGRLNG